MVTEITSQTFPEFPETTIRFPSYGGYVDIPLIPEYTRREEGLQYSLQGIRITGPKTIPVYEVWESNNATTEPFCWPLQSGTSWKKASGTYKGMRCVQENFGGENQFPEYDYHLCEVDSCSVIDNFPNPKYSESFCTPFEYFTISLPASRGDLLPYARFHVSGIYDTTKTYTKLSAEGFCIAYDRQKWGQPLTIEQLPPKQLVMITGFYDGSCYTDGCYPSSYPLDPYTEKYCALTGKITYFCNGNAPCVTFMDAGFYTTYREPISGKIHIRPTVGPLYVREYNKSYAPIDSPISSKCGSYYKGYTSAFLCGACDPSSFEELNKIKWINIYKTAAGEADSRESAEFNVVAEYIDADIPEDILDRNKNWVDVFVKSNVNHAFYVDGKKYIATDKFCRYKVYSSLTFTRTGSEDTNCIYYIANPYEKDTPNHWNCFSLGKIHFLNITSNTDSGEINGYYQVYNFCVEDYYCHTPYARFYGQNPAGDISHAQLNYYNSVCGIRYDCGVSIPDANIGYQVIKDSDGCVYFNKKDETMLDPSIYVAGFCTNLSLNTCVKHVSMYEDSSCVNYTTSIRGSCNGGYLMWYNSPVLGIEVIYNSSNPSGCWTETLYTHATGSLLQVKVDCSYTCSGGGTGGTGGSTSIPSYWPVCTPCIYIGPNCGQRLYYGNKLVQEAYWNEQRIWWS